MSKLFPVLQVPLKALREPEVNPNILDEEDYTLLVHGMGSEGFLQPPLIWDRGNGAYEIVDGVHRCRAATACGLQDIPCVVLPADFSAHKVSLIRVALNKLRGQVSTSKVARILAEIAEVEPDMDLTISGFKEEAVEDLILSLETPKMEDLLRDVQDSDTALTPVLKRFTLELTFDSKQDLLLAKKALKEAGGGNITLGFQRLAGL